MFRNTLFIKTFVLISLIFGQFGVPSNENVFFNINGNNDSIVSLDINTNMISNQENPILWATNATKKIFKSTDNSQNLYTEPINNKNAHLIMARNSIESFQVVLTAGNNNLDNINIQTSDLFSQSGKILSSNNIKIYYEYYINVSSETSYESVLNYELGEYPDALIPLTNSISVKAQQNQPFWVQITIPGNTTPGTYTGSISTTGSYQQSIQLQIDVLDYSLPKTFPLVNFAYADYWILNSYSEYTSQELKSLKLEYTKFLAEHGILTIGSYDAYDILPTLVNEKWQFQEWWDSIKPFTDIWAQYMNPLLLQVPIDFEEMFQASLDDAADNEIQNEYVNYLTQFKEFVKQNSEVDKSTVWYVWIEDLDEPDSALKAWLFGKYAELTASVNSPDFQFHYRVDGSIDWDSDAVAYDLDTDISDWTNLADKFTMLHAPQEDFAFDKEFIMNAVTNGNKVFMYQQAWSSFSPNDEEIPPGFAKDISYEFPSVPGIVNPALFSRILPWFAITYNLTGIGFWAVMAWYDAPDDKILDMFTANPALRIYDGSDERVQNGDGWLIYPGNKISEHTNQQNVFGPIGSIRLDLFRKGIEDYKYLKLLQESMINFDDNSRNNGLLLVNKVRKLLGSVTTFSRDISEYNTLLLDIKELLNQTSNLLLTDFNPIDWKLDWSPSSVTDYPLLNTDNYSIIIGVISGFALIGILIFVYLKKKKLK